MVVLHMTQICLSDVRIQAVSSQVARWSSGQHCPLTKRALGKCKHCFRHRISLCCLNWTCTLQNTLLWYLINCKSKYHLRWLTHWQNDFLTHFPWLSQLHTESRNGHVGDRNRIPFLWLRATTGSWQLDSNLFNAGRHRMYTIVSSAVLFIVCLLGLSFWQKSCSMQVKDTTTTTTCHKETWVCVSHVEGVRTSCMH